MKRIVVTAGMAALFLFCTYGFLASFEPMPRTEQWIWRSIYAAGAMLYAAAIVPVWPRSGKIITIAAAALTLLGVVFVAMVAFLAWSAQRGMPM